MQAAQTIAQDASNQKRFWRGTHRTRSPDETLALLIPHLRAFGITRVAVVTGLDTIGIPVVMVTRPASWSLSVTQGKGLTLVAAKVSGLMEAVEHAHAEEAELPLLYKSESELARRRTPIETSRVAVTDHDRECSMLWTSGRSLTDDRELWLPYELVHLDHRVSALGDSRLGAPTSNGLASGNCWEEAVCHGLFEVVERHQLAAFHDLDAAAQARRRVNLASVSDADCAGLLARMAAAEVDAAVWDLSDALGVPCFLCDLLSRRHDPFRAVPRARGLGCHSNKAIALSRALCEAAQSRLTIIAGSRDDIAVSATERARQREAWAVADQQRKLASGAELAYANIKSWNFESFDDERRWLLAGLGERGFGQAVAVDLSKADLPVSVVRIVVPGLRMPTPAGSRISSRGSR